MIVAWIHNLSWARNRDWSLVSMAHGFLRLIDVQVLRHFAGCEIHGFRK